MCKKCRNKSKKTCKPCKLCNGVVTALLAATGLLFVVYFWNLDQKLLGWAYKNVNKIFDRKPTDIKF